MTGDGPVRDLCRSIADHRRIGDEGLAPIADTFTGQPQRASGSQAGREVPPQGAAPLNIKHLINGLVADAHTQVLGKVPLQALRNLLWAPRSRPASALPMHGASSFPYHDGPVKSHAVGRGDQARQPILHVVAQRRNAGQLARLWSLGGSLGMPLCGDGTIVEIPGTRRGVPSDLPRDRAR